MLYLCIARPRISCSGRASSVSFCPFRPKNRPGEGFTKCFVIFSAGFVVFSKCRIIFSKCFLVSRKQPAVCFRRLKTLKFSPAYLWKTACKYRCPRSQPSPTGPTTARGGTIRSAAGIAFSPPRYAVTPLMGEKPVYRELREQAPLPLTKIPHGKTYAVSSAGRMGIAPFFVHTKAEVWTASVWASATLFPFRMAAINAAVKLSPAPTVSATSTFGVG